MGNFSIALSGLQADSIELNTIGNNLANLNTTAYKGQTTSFEDLFYQQIGESGSGDAIQVGAGTRVRERVRTSLRRPFFLTRMRIRPTWLCLAMVSLSCSKVGHSR